MSCTIKFLWGILNEAALLMRLSSNSNKVLLPLGTKKLLIYMYDCRIYYFDSTIVIGSGNVIT